MNGLEIAIFLFLFSLNSGGESEDIRSKLPETWNWSPDSSGPVCGVYAACRAASILNKEIDPAIFLNSKFIGHPNGSTPEELVDLIKECGLTATPLDSISTLEMHAMGCPIIANVRRSSSKTVYNHWVCVLATANGYLVFDGPSEGTEISSGEFLALFSGKGILVSRETNFAFLVFARLVGPFILVGIGFLTLLIRKSCNDGILRQLSTIGIATSIVTITGFVIFGSSSGYLDGCKIASLPFVDSLVREGSLVDIRGAKQSRNKLLVDSRTVDSFLLGSIDRAVNIPVNVSASEIAKYLSELPRDTPIVVFCQSAQCAYDTEIGRVLWEIGFSDITVSDEGYREYKLFYED